MDNYIENSGFGNHILYRMCREYPLHDNPEVIGDKLWLIGRAYAAAVERKAGKDFDWTPLKKRIVSSDIDQRLERCRQVKRVDNDNLPDILSTHKMLTDIFKQATGLEKRSLASKYLHFHAPGAFFLFDSISAKSVQKKIRHLRIKSSAEGAYDDAYEVFCKRCLLYRDKVLEPELDRRVSLRHLDTTLQERSATS